MMNFRYLHIVALYNWGIAIPVFSCEGGRGLFLLLQALTGNWNFQEGRSVWSKSCCNNVQVKLVSEDRFHANADSMSLHPKLMSTLMQIRVIFKSPTPEP